MIGYLVNRLNRELLSIIKNYQPKILFLYRGSHIEANTLNKIRILVPTIYIISYNNDDPFSTKYPGGIGGTLIRLFLILIFIIHLYIEN